MHGGCHLLFGWDLALRGAGTWHIDVARLELEALTQLAQFMIRKKRKKTKTRNSRWEFCRSYAASRAISDSSVSHILSCQYHPTAHSAQRRTTHTTHHHPLSTAPNHQHNTPPPTQHSTTTHTTRHHPLSTALNHPHNAPPPNRHWQPNSMYRWSKIHQLHLRHETTVKDKNHSSAVNNV